MNNIIQLTEIEPNDIVKITGNLKEQGRFAKVLRVQKQESGDTLFTIKVNNYWNSADMVKKYGVWNGQLWIALSCDQFEIELKRKAKAKRDTTQQTQEKRVI
ncbi:hypothetical protein [Paenibacillus aestuarii]|uniref:DUF3127 domain-containing protein n=1 Tax=Paenibacillus aestuarii TaxID=516965 RepID=A0ABW0K6X2_9BACL|nr:hypothetical protein [Paenibacillus aestuarii]